MERLYSLLTIKSVNDDERIIEGIATTPTPDRVGDIVEPKGAKYTLPIPLLYQHNARQPIGQVIAARVTGEGIAIKAKIAKGVVPFIDEAWALIKEGLIRGLSIGFKPIESARIRDTFSEHIQKWEWLELSVVTIPANVEANIQTVKSLDSQLRAASGNDGVPIVRLRPPPGATGKQQTGLEPVFFRPEQRNDMKTTQEQIASFEAKRAASVGRMDAIMTKANEELRSLDGEEQTEYDGLKVEVKATDDHIARMKEHEQIIVKQAVAVQGNPDPNNREGQAEAGSQARQGVPPVVMGKSNLPKGIAFTRYAMAIAAGRGSKFEAIEYAKRWHDTTPEVELMLKAAVAAGTTTTSGWASQLVVAQNMASEFIELLRPMSIIGRIPGIRRVPFNISVPLTSAGTTAGWVGQGAPKPVTRMTFDQISLTQHKIANIVVLTEELVRSSNPSAEAIVRDDMLRAIAQFRDQQFIDPTVAASGTTSPASVTYGANAHSMTGSTIANITTDISTLFADFSNANNNLDSPVFVMHPRTARYLSMLRTTQDVFAFPTINQNGGTFFGIPVITSNSVPIDTGADTYIFLINASDILVADDGGIEVDVSREASVQMDSAPSGGAQALVSLWQNNLVGLRAEQFITWARRRPSAVSYLEDVTY